jgi:hypothetical protein
LVFAKAAATDSQLDRFFEPEFQEECGIANLSFVEDVVTFGSAPKEFELNFV